MSAIELSVTGHGRTSGGDELAGLAGEVSRLARSFQAEPDVQATLRGIVEAALHNVAGADHAGITLVTRGGRVSTPAASDALVEQIDAIQYETGEGPCLSSAREQITVRADDLSGERRWPLFAGRAVVLGIRSMLCFQLYVQDEDLGALNLYSQTPGAFDPIDEEMGLLLAAHAAIAMVGAQRENNLRAAVAHRDIIGQAKGILMERHKITAQVAFAVLTKASQAHNRKLHEIAADVAATGVVPEHSPPRRT